ncbi:MAG: hypothetical protein JW904_01315 [Spirochaetales bacterium]|nr:hypothetical protein [Spirochaetales bacterium]
METINNIELHNESVFPDEQALRTLLEKSAPCIFELRNSKDIVVMLPAMRFKATAR